MASQDKTGPRRRLPRSGYGAQAKLDPDAIGDRYQGGPYCSDEYDASRDL